MAVKTGTVRLEWAGGEYPFRLAIAEWQELYRRVLKLLVQMGVSESVAMTEATPVSICNRIAKGNPLPGELGELVFQSLIGGGMSPSEAGALRKRYCDERPLLECVPMMYSIVLVSLMGPPEPEGAAPKKAEAEDAPSSPSADSTKTAPASATRRKKSTT